MKPDKILFVGLGGAGQRHLRIFREKLGPGAVFTAFRSTGRTPLLNPDFSVDPSATAEAHYGLQTFASLEEALDDRPDLTVISTPTSLHFEAARMVAERNIGVFVEKPFSHNLAGFGDFSKRVLSNGLPFFVSYQRRFHPLIQKAQDAVTGGRLGRITSAVFNVGSYVPAWHPYEDFRDLYACRKDLGGGVLLTEIHEIDLSVWFFGMPRAVFCAGGTLAGVDMDVEDTAHLTLDYEGLVVNINLCFMQRPGRRDFFIYGTKGSLEWNADGNVLSIQDHDTGETETFAEPEFSNDQMFRNQADHFLTRITPADSERTLETARASIAIVLAAKESMETGRSVAP